MHGANRTAVACYRVKLANVVTYFDATAHVVRLPNANHYIFNSNRDDVVREIISFIATLP